MSATTTRNVLVIANETIEGAKLHDAITGLHDVEVLVVAPALNTRIRHWTSDEDRARTQAAVRLEGCVTALAAAGVDVQGWVGDADPLRAIADALVVFAADELIIATHPEHRSNWLAHDLVARACARFSLPVGHIVVEHVAPARPVLAAVAA
jgi:GNAT superfamily N-acetyltransferase